MKPKYKWLEFKSNGGEEIKGNWSDDIPKGWNISFGEEMINELNRIIEEYNISGQYEILQIKEKYGCLRWYSSGITEEAHDDYENWLTKYEEKSRVTCIECGKKSTHKTKGWVIPLCDACGKTEKQKV